VVGGLLSFHGISGFLANSIEVHGFDTDREIWTPYLKYWHEHWHEPLTAARLLDLASSSPEFAALEPRSDSGSAYNRQSLGIALKGRVGRYYGDPDDPVKFYLQRNYDTHSKLNKFRVMKYEPEPKGKIPPLAIEPPPAEPEQAEPYAGYNMSQLRGLANKHGVSVKQGITRDELIKALADAGITP
jgi:hypothetical protein